MFRRGFVLGLVVLVVTTRPSIGQTIPPPKGGTNYFGSPQDQTFKSDSIFTSPPKMPPVEPPPVGPDGGLFPAPPPPPKIWKGSAEIGLNGASGNSELLNIRAGLDAQRRTQSNIFTTDFLYNYADVDGATSANQALWNARDEILFQGTPWSAFGSLNLEYDRLRAYHFRVGIYAGAGYLLIDDETTTFKLRAGAGAVREFDGPLLPEDPYELLGVPRDAGPRDLRRAYTRLIRAYKPEQHPEQFRRIRAAYEAALRLAELFGTGRDRSDTTAPAAPRLTSPDGMGLAGLLRASAGASTRSLSAPIATCRAVIDRPSRAAVGPLAPASRATAATTTPSRTPRT